MLAQGDNWKITGDFEKSPSQADQGALQLVSIIRIKPKHHPTAKYDDDDEKPVDGEHDDVDPHLNKHDDDDFLLRKYHDAAKKY